MTDQTTGVPTPAVRTSATDSATSGSFLRRNLSLIVGIGVILVLLVVGGITEPEFVTGPNFLNVVRAASITGIVALGLTFITISGNYFSLSVAQTAVLSSIVYATVASSAGFLPALVAVVLLCVLVGAVQGAIIGVGGNPVVVTLAAGAAILGIVLLVTNSVRVRLTVPGDSLAAGIGRSAPLGIPMATWSFLVLAVVGYLLLQRTTLGRRTMLVGANKSAAVAIGMNVRFVVISAFVISALAAGVAGILTAAEFGVADTAQFPDLDINAVAAVLVGGTAIKGGQGSIIQTCIGALCISLLRNYLQIAGFSTGVQLVFVGVAVVLAVSGYALVKGSRR
jgi:ribose transport system permease protein